MSIGSADQLQALFKQLNCKSIVYNKAYYKLTDCIPGAILLSHLSYLFSEVFGGQEFYQSDEQLKQSLGFSDRTLRTAKDSTKKYLISTKRGVPAKNHWRVAAQLIITDLLALPPPSSSKVVRTSHVENDRTVAVENDTTGDVENDSSNNKELQKNKELKNNSKVVVAEKIMKKALSLGITERQISTLIATHGEQKVIPQLDRLAEAKGVSTPIAWLTYAIKENIAPMATTGGLKIPSPAPMALASHEAWDENKYKANCRELEQLSDPNDWRNKLFTIMEAPNSQ